jgi:hypothetical protein
MAIRSAAELAGAELDRVQVAVAESKRPWTGETAVLLVGRATGSLAGEGTITVGLPSKIAEMVEGMLSHPYIPNNAKRDAGGKKALRLLKQAMPLKGYKKCVRFVIRGDAGDWYIGPLVEPR